MTQIDRIIKLRTVYKKAGFCFEWLSEPSGSSAGYYAILELISISEIVCIYEYLPDDIIDQLEIWLAEQLAEKVGI